MINDFLVWIILWFFDVLLGLDLFLFFSLQDFLSFSFPNTYHNDELNNPLALVK